MNAQLQPIEKSETELLVYMGKRLSAFCGDVHSGLDGLFMRGVPRVVDTDRASGVVARLFPEYQILNKDKIYVGPSYTVGDFSEIEDGLAPDANILLIRDMGLGDILMSLPTVQAIRQRLPQAHIIYATLKPYFPLVDGLSLVDEIIQIHDVDFQNGKHDAVFNWMRCLENYDIPRNLGRRIDSFALMLGLPAFAKQTHYIAPVVSEKDRAFIDGLLHHAPGPYIGYVFQAAAWNRSYPPWRAHEVCEALHEYFDEHKILIFDSQEDFHLFDDLDYVIPLNGKTTIMQAGAAMQKCDMVVSPDTGLAHLAACLDVPTLALLSSQPFETRYDHYGAHVEYILKEGAAPCIPCLDWQRADYVGYFCSRTKNNICMREIQPVEIAVRSAHLAAKFKGRKTA